MLSVICFVKLIKRFYVGGECMCQMVQFYVTHIAFVVFNYDFSPFLRIKEFLSINIIERLALVICVQCVL